MKRVLCLIDCLGAGGAERQLAYLAILLKKRGYTVMFVAFTKQYKFYESMLVEGGVTPIYNLPGINRWRRIWEIAKIVKKFRPDMTIAYKDGVCISAILAKIFGNFHLIVSERSSTPVLSKMQKIKVFLFRFADYVVPNSYAQAENLARFSPRLTSKIRVIPNGIDTTVFYPNNAQQGDRIPEILTTARIDRLKNIINYLKAISIIKNKGIKCHFSWYGKPTENDQYPQIVQAEVERLSLGDYISFYPATNSVADIYRNADIFCLPSIIEGFPNVICEAMASGLPVVCSRICDNPRIVQDEINGLLFDPLSPEDIAYKLIRMIHTPQEKKRDMGAANMLRINELCSEDTFVANYERLLP